MKMNHRKTCKRYDIEGQAHCLTFSCFKRQPFLLRQCCCQWLAEPLEAGRAKGLDTAKAQHLVFLASIWKSKPRRTRRARSGWEENENPPGPIPFFVAFVLFVVSNFGLRRSEAKLRQDLWGYVFMPEQVHLVLLPHPEAKISRILTTMKASVAKRALLWVRTHAPAFLGHMEDRQPNGRCHYRFWQRGGGYDRNLRTGQDVREKINYIHANPLRRGLVATPDGWHWSSYRAWQTGLDEPIPIDRESLM